MCQGPDHPRLKVRPQTPDPGGLSVSGSAVPPQRPVSAPHRHGVCSAGGDSQILKHTSGATNKRSPDTLHFLHRFHCSTSSMCFSSHPGPRSLCPRPSLSISLHSQREKHMFLSDEADILKLNTHSSSLAAFFSGAK